MLRRPVNHHVQPGRVGLRKEHLVWDATGTELRMLREQRVIARLSEATGGWWYGNVVGSMSAHIASPSKWTAQQEVEAVARRMLGNLIAA
jgi:hypothetical protein